MEHVGAIDAVLAFRCGIEVCPQKVRLGVVRMMVPFVFSRVAAPPPLCALESEGSEDGRLDLLKSSHVESVCRLVCLPRKSIHFQFNLS